MSQEKLPIREISKARICWHILKRRQDKPVNECAEAILKSLEEEFNYRLIPELTLLTDEEMEVLLFQYIMPQDSFQKSIYIDLMKIGIQAHLSKNKKELGQ